MRLRFLFALLLTLPGLSAAAPAPDARKEGAELTATFYQQHIDTVWQRMSPELQAALKSRDNLAAFRTQIGEQLGAETTVVEEKVDHADGYSLYLRRAHFEKVPMVILVQWAIDAKGVVGGFFIRPDQTAAQVAAASTHLDYQTRTALRLPFQDEFQVFWGGRSVEQNYHAVDGNQRFALDMLILRDGKSHTGDGRRNTDYHCFGRPVLAPAAGKVVEALDGIAENVPGEVNSRIITGNHVILDHGNDEFSVLAHLRNGSLRVKWGDVVKVGDRLGDCGNSGNSSEPHLHYQLQDGPAFGTSAGLPTQFFNYVADDQPVARGEPTRGQRIRPATQP